MLPDFSVLIGLILALYSLEAGPAPDPSRTLLGVALCLLVGSAAARMAAQRGLRAVEDNDTLGAIGAVRWTSLWPLLAWIGAIVLFHWGGAVQATIPRTWWIARYVVLLVPGVLLFAVGWAARWDIESALVRSHGSTPTVFTRMGAVRAGLRRNAIAVLPLFILTALIEGLWLLGQWGVEPLRAASRWMDHMPVLTLAVFFVLMLIALPFLPRLIARVLGAERLPDGQLRDRLEAGAKAIGLRVGHIMVWPTKGRILNAMVVGVTPRSRTIILTDHIIEQLPQDELLAVFFHEAGHAKLQHILLYLGLFFGITAIFYAMNDSLLASGLGPNGILLFQLLVIWFLLFGAISRRFEREADAFGADHAGVLDPEGPEFEPAPGMTTPVPRGAARMMRALEHLRIVTGGRGPSHRHGTLQDRIQFLGAYATDTDVRNSFRGSRRLLRIGIVGALVFSAWSVAQRWPLDLQRAHASMATEDGHAAVDRAQDLVANGNNEAATPVWEAAYASFRAAAERIGPEPSSPIDAIRRAEYLIQAASIALDDLDDRARARTGFDAAEQALKHVGTTDLIPQTGLDQLRFLTWTGAARVAASEQRYEVAADYLSRVELMAQSLSTSADVEGADRAWYTELRGLVRAVVEGHAARAATPVQGDTLEAAQGALRQLAGGKNPKQRWVALRRAAAVELARLERD